MNSLLLDSIQNSYPIQNQRILLLSVNPDLKSDFGHYLNYEKRINEACNTIGIFHHCLANNQFGDIYPYISGVFDHDSGHYCLHRRSATGQEWLITSEFYDLVLEWISKYTTPISFEYIVVFVYMSSSKSAAILSCMKWPPNVRLVCNSFWDFLSSTTDSVALSISRLQLQSDITLMALSSTYRDIIYKEQGILLDFIPNPPPLASDDKFFNYLRSSYAIKSIRPQSQIELFLPSLMTMGKGREFTASFLMAADRSLSHISFTVRDRQDELRKELSFINTSQFKLLSGDFDDHGIIDLYTNADIAILPYSSKVFLFRTSGALVDCLMTSTIPIVFPNTWLSDICHKYNFGVIAASESVEDVLVATCYAVDNLKSERVRMFAAAFKYMRVNSWKNLISKVLFCHGLIDEVCADAAWRSANIPISNKSTSAPDIQNYADHTGFTLKHSAERDSTVRIGIMDIMLERLIESSDPDSMKMLLTTVGSRMLLNSKEAKDNLINNAKVKAAVEKALSNLPKEHGSVRRFHQILDNAKASKR